MSRFKDFGAGDSGDSAPLSFKIHGEEFHCVRNIQGKLLLDLVSKTRSDDPATSAGIITEFFSYVLEDESYVRFDALLNDKYKIVSVDTLGEITGWLMGEYTNRPTEGPEVS